MFMDISSELVHSLLPIFLTSVLGASMVTLGFLEGVAEATAAMTKVFSGVLSDYLGKRTFLVALGYGLSAMTKVAFRWRRRLTGCSPLGSPIGSARHPGRWLRSEY
jgi:hypothetical protein